MLNRSHFIKNPDIIVEDRDSWKNMGFNDKTKLLPDKGGIPNFFKTVRIEKAVKSARLSATALGIFDVFINEERVGEKAGDGIICDELKPGWTDYSHRVFCFTYDVTSWLNTGENSIRAEVSCGWYSCRISFGIYGFMQPAFCAELVIEYTDGTNETIVTDDSWDTALGGAVRTADIWDGEYYDATQKDVFTAKKPAVIVDYSGETVPALPPRILVRKELELHPVSAVVFEGTSDNGTDFGRINVKYKKEGESCENVTLSKAQRLILDMGQNAVGRPHIKIRAKRGTKLTFYFGELLNDSGREDRGNDGAEGSVYVKNYRSALSRFVYVTSGDGIEEYAARHTFFGYRYLEIETSSECEILSVYTDVVGSVNRETAMFSCSDDDVNKLWSNIVWGQRSNYLSIPTDCPQRDERLGWTGDTHIFCGAGSYIADIHDFMKKWLQDARDSQSEDGSYCDVIPKVFHKENFFGNAAWGDGLVILPHILYEKYGDMSVISEHFASMERYMEYLSQYGTDGANTAYGDWLCYEVTDKRYIAVAFYAYDAYLMAEYADILDLTEKASHYRSLFEKIKASFAERYIKDDEITEKTQTGYLLALRFGLLSPEQSEKAKKALRKKIEDNDYTLSTGFVGTGILCTTLADMGMNDLCYALLLQTRDPSWLYSVHQGATTVWERWNSYTKEKGFGNVNMNSFNHYAYGAVAEWMMKYMAGIGTLLPGFSHPYIAPKIDRQKRITYVNARYSSCAGDIVSSWRITDKGCVYEIEVPTLSTIEIELFGGEAELDGIPVETDGDRLVFEVGEGKHVLVISN